MKRISLLLLLLAATVSARAASLVEGRVYLKNGTVVQCTGNDRIELPEKWSRLRIFRDAYHKTKAKEMFRPEEVDSLVCWHPKAPQYVRKFVPADRPGWMWVYVETPDIKVCVWSAKGYGIDNDGGIQVWQRQRAFGKSRAAYYLKKQGEERFQGIGSYSNSPSDSFRESIARYIDDDPPLAERIRQSSAIRSKTLLMLQDYNPTRK